MAILEALALQATSQVATRTKEVLGEWAKDYGKKVPQYATSYSKVTGSSSVTRSTAPATSQPSAPPLSLLNNQPTAPAPQVCSCKNIYL